MQCYSVRLVDLDGGGAGGGHDEVAEIAERPESRVAHDVGPNVERVAKEA